MIEVITEKITIGKDEISIDLFYLPSFSESMTLRQYNFRNWFR